MRRRGAERPERRGEGAERGVRPRRLRAQRESIASCTGNVFAHRDGDARGGFRLPNRSSGCRGTAGPSHGRRRPPASPGGSSRRLPPTTARAAPPSRKSLAAVGAPNALVPPGLARRTARRLPQRGHAAGRAPAAAVRPPRLGPNPVDDARFPAVVPLLGTGPLTVDADARDPAWPVCCAASCVRLLASAPPGLPAGPGGGRRRRRHGVRPFELLADAGLMSPPASTAPACARC
jgi:hypothetical protein